MESVGALARETALIDDARLALEAGRLSDVHSALDEYERSQRVGVLNREALVLRIELLLRQGRTANAQALTDRFAASYPGDPHLVRLRSRLAAQNSGIEPSLPRH